MMSGCGPGAKLFGYPRAETVHQLFTSPGPVQAREQRGGQQLHREGPVDDPEVADAHLRLAVARPDLVVLPPPGLRIDAQCPQHAPVDRPEVVREQQPELLLRRPVCTLEPPGVTLAQGHRLLIARHGYTAAATGTRTEIAKSTNSSASRPDHVMAMAVTRSSVSDNVDARASPSFP